MIINQTDEAVVYLTANLDKGEVQYKVRVRIPDWDLKRGNRGRVEAVFSYKPEVLANWRQAKWPELYKDRGPFFIDWAEYRREGGKPVTDHQRQAMAQAAQDLLPDELTVSQCGAARLIEADRILTSAEAEASRIMDRAREAARKLQAAE